MDNKLVHKQFIAETKAAEGDDRTLVVRISTPTPDRSKDVVVPLGVKLDNYKRNPVVLPSHDYRSLAIAKAEDIEVSEDAITAKVKFPEKGIFALADTYYEMYKQGFQNAWSIGFIPLKDSQLENGGRQFDEWELLEFSAVSVPDNPEALTLLRSIQAKGIDTTEFENVSKGIGKDEEKEQEKKEDPAEEGKEKEEEKSVEKEGRVLSTKNKELVEKIVGQMDGLTNSLKELLAATNKEPKIEDSKFIKSVDALKLADQVIGKALRDIKQG